MHFLAAWYILRANSCLKLFFSISIFILLCIPALSQNPYQSLVSSTHAKRLEKLLVHYDYYLIIKDSVSIFNTIDSIRQVAVINNDNDLLMETALLRAHYFYYRAEFPADMVLPMIDSIKTAAAKQKKVWAEALAENMMALYNFDHLKHYQQGFEHHERVYELIKNLPASAFPHKQNCLYQMARNYYYFSDFRESIIYNKLALEEEPSFKMHVISMRVNILNTIGLAYQNLGMLDSSDYYLRGAYDLAVKENSRVWQGISSGNLGYNLFLGKQFSQAVPLLEKDVTIAIENADWGLASGSLMVLANISLQQHDMAKAGKQVMDAREYVYRSKQYKRLQQLYPLLSRLYAAQGKTALATVYMDSALFVKDSVAREFNALLMMRAKQKVELEKYRSEVDSIESRRKLNIVERNILIAAILLLMAGAIFVYKQQRKKYRLKQQELETATRQLTDFARNISEKNTLIEMLEQQHGDETSDALEQLRQSTILTDDDWEYFRNLFEKVHHGFLHRLKEKIPGLTPAETRFIVLSKLSLSGKEMAAMLGIGADAIRQLRSRVKKKLDLGEESSIESLISQI